ncbi:MAG: hypothetical protein HFJ59_01545 [Clostridia bacterium]|nr:hypothetical protein [Clostridia bacterium]
MIYNKEKVYDIEEFISKLEVGMKMPVQLKRTDGVTLVERGRIVTERTIEQLKRMKDRIEHIQLDDMDSKDADDILNIGRKPKETVDIKVMEEVEHCLKELSNNFNSSIVQDIKGSMKGIVDAIEQSTDFQHNIERRYIQQLNDKSSHSVIVACFSILLAKRYNDRLKLLNPKLSKDALIKLEDIAMAAVLQDIGKSCEDSEHLKRIPPLEKIPGIKEIQEKLPAIKDVPLDRYDERYSSVYSYLLLGSLSEGTINKDVKMMVLLSNEPETGKGCLRVPENISNQKRPNIEGAKVIHICDIFDKSMKKAIEQEHSLEEVASEINQYTVDGTINRELGEIFMRNVQLYPINTRVVLSDNRIARVIKNYYNKYDVYKPTVQIVATNGIIDLRKRTDITIKSMITRLLYPRLVSDQVQAMKNKTMTTLPVVEEETR